MYPNLTILPNILTNYARPSMNYFNSMQMPMILPMPRLIKIPNLFNFSMQSYLPKFNFSLPNFSLSSIMGVAKNVTKKFSNIVGATKGSISKMLEIARAELRKGVHETSKNDSAEIRKYKLGAKNGNAWCAAFTTWCAKMAGLCRNGLKWTYSSQGVRKAAEKQGKFAKKTQYNPKVGDFAIWTNVGDKSHGHIGIVDEVSNGYVYIIEGNSGNAVKRNKYLISKLNKTSRFNGYVKTSEWVA